jgi:ferric-dicitrate binding protein FerR (iron transport regulator)
MIDKIVRYLKGELAGEEREELIDWINANEENQRYFEEIEEAWHAAAITHKEPFDADKAWRKFRAHNYQFRRKKRSLHHILKYAALIVIFLGLGWGGHLLFTDLQKGGSASFMELSVPRGETASFTFADQSRVQLNAGSSIRFPEQFGKKKREVYLEGEAYFQVADNKQKPFVVHAIGLDIKVLGTAFNVRSYPDEDIVETTLEEGQLEVSASEKEGKKKMAWRLNKNEQFRYFNKGDSSQLNKNVDTELYTSWKEGHYKFQKIKLGRLAKSLERLYDVEIQFENRKLKDLTYTGSFYKDEPVDKVLEMVEMSSEAVKVNQLKNKQFSITRKIQ